MREKGGRSLVYYEITKAKSVYTSPKKNAIGHNYLPQHHKPTTIFILQQSTSQLKMTL